MGSRTSGCVVPRGPQQPASTAHQQSVKVTSGNLVRCGTGKPGWGVLHPHPLHSAPPNPGGKRLSPGPATAQPVRNGHHPETSLSSGGNHKALEAAAPPTARPHPSFLLFLCKVRLLFRLQDLPWGCQVAGPELRLLGPPKRARFAGDRTGALRPTTVWTE